MRGFIWFFGLLLVGLIGGAIGYNIGISANLAAAGTAVAVPVYGFGFGFPFFGLIFGIFFLFLIFGLIGRVAFGGRRGWGPGGPGPNGHWGYGRDEAFQRWHRQAHGEEQPPVASQPPAMG